MKVRGFVVGLSADESDLFILQNVQTISGEYCERFQVCAAGVFELFALLRYYVACVDSSSKKRRPTTTNIRCVISHKSESFSSGSSFPGLKWPGLGIYHLRPSSVEVKNGWIYTSNSHVPQWRAQKKIYLHTLSEHFSNPLSAGSHYETNLSKTSFMNAFEGIPGYLWWHL